MAAPRLTGGLSMCKKTSRPTIMRRNSSSLTSRVSTVPTIFASRITLTRSLISFTSRSLWLMKITVLPL